MARLAIPNGTGEAKLQLRARPDQGYRHHRRFLGSNVQAEPIGFLP